MYKTKQSNVLQWRRWWWCHRVYPISRDRWNALTASSRLSQRPDTSTACLPGPSVEVLASYCKIQKDLRAIWKLSFSNLRAICYSWNQSTSRKQSICLHALIFVNPNESNPISDSESFVYLNPKCCHPIFIFTLIYIFNVHYVYSKWDQLVCSASVTTFRTRGSLCDNVTAKLSFLSWWLI